MPPRPRPDRHDFLTLARRPLRVVLDGVSRLPNIGTMFRLCDAFRVERLYVCGFDLQLHKRKLVTAAAGTLAWVPWEARPDAESVAREARAAGYSIAAVELGPTSVPPGELRSDAPLCLVVGAESQGVSAGVLAMADQLIEIPTDGIGGSINLTCAAAIVLHEAARRYPLEAPVG
jgi:23S rRNA (guanosine2251-2'-O)-methyltransferase